MNFTRRAFFSSALLGGISRLISISSRFVSLPLTVHLLTESRYGLWLIINSLIGWLSFSDLGIPSALQNRLVIVLAKGGNNSAGQLVAYASRVLLVVAGILFIFGGSLAWLLPWEKILKIDDLLKWEFSLALLLCLLGFCIGLPSRIGASIFNAHGKLGLPPAFDVISQLISLAMLLLAVWMHWQSLLAMVACSLSGIILGPVLLTGLAVCRLKYNLEYNGASSEDKTAILGKGAFFMFTAVGEILILQTDAFLVGYLKGAAAVAHYVVPFTIFVSYLQIQNIFLRPLWPILSSLQAQRKHVELNKLILVSLAITAIFGGLFLIGTVVAGDWFTQFWTRGLVRLPKPMAWGIGFLGLICSIDNTINNCLNAFGLIEKRFIFILVFGFAKVITCWFILQSDFSEWIFIAVAICAVIFSIPFSSVALVRSLRKNRFLELP